MITGAIIGTLAIVAGYVEPPADTDTDTDGEPEQPQATPEPALSISRTRPLTMEDVSSPPQELRLGAVRSRYTLNFFGDTSLSIARPVAPGRYLSFALGAQDLLLKGELGNHIVATTEIAIEPHDPSVVVDVERFNVRWQSDLFFVEAGRTHTLFGYWNNAYHHGTWLQPAIERPRWVAFEDDGGILPVHWVGLDLGARLNVGSGRLNLFASVGNSRGKIVDDVRNSGDYQSLKAFHVAAEFVGIHWPELRAGVSAIFGQIPAQPVAIRPSLPDRSINETIGGAYVACARFPLILLSEGYLVDHESHGTHWTTYGGFGLLGYAFGRFTPYGEVERVAHRGGQDPFFTPDPTATDSLSFDTIKGIGGLRVDLSDWTAIKAEYRYTRFLDNSASILQEGVINWSWGF